MKTLRLNLTTAKKSLVAACCLFLFVGAAFAQEYKEANVDESLKDQKATVLASADSEQIKNFLSKYYLARWTVPGNMRELHKYREEVEKDAVELSGDAQKTFLKEVVNQLKSYAGSAKCFPACRYNAVLTIGSLNVKASTDRNVPPKTYAEAESVLNAIVKSDKEVPDYVRYGALIGLVRHAQCGIEDEKARAAIKSTFAQVLDPKYAEAHNVRDEIFECFQESAIAGLASFKSPEGTKGGTGTLDLFRKMIENKDSAFELRCTAVKAIGDMKLEGVKYDYVALSRSLVTLARDFCVEESAYIDSEIVRDQVKSAAGGMGGMGGMSGGPGGMGGSMSGGLGGGMDMMGGGMPGMGGGPGGMSGGMGGGMGGGIQNQKTMEAIVARVQYGFECIQTAIKGKKDGGEGVLAKLDANDEKQADSAKMLKDALDEFKSTNEFIAEGPKNGGNMMSMGVSMDMGYGGAAMGSNIKVDASSMKDHLLEKKLKFNELLGIDSY